MKVISGSVNSWLASLIISIASASGSRPSVADRCGCPWPPTPGVSTKARPCLSSGLLAVTSTRSTSRPRASGARRRSFLRLAGGIAITSGSAPSGPATISCADACSEYETTVASTVVSSSPTRATGTFSRELSNWLLPCLSWPAITTRICGSAMRTRARPSRSARSPRSLSSAIFVVWSISSRMTFTCGGRWVASWCPFCFQAC